MEPVVGSYFYSSSFGEFDISAKCNYARFKRNLPNIVAAASAANAWVLLGKLPSSSMIPIELAMLR